MIRTLLAALLVLSPLTGCAQEHSAGNSAQALVASAPTSPTSNSLTLVKDRSLVCMVNDQYMGRPQIPVTVGNKTYYGCCPACKDRLQNDASARLGIDPVSKKPVDKAAATIAMTESGTALYFESVDTLATYSNGTVAR